MHGFDSSLRLWVPLSSVLAPPALPAAPSVGGGAAGVAAGSAVRSDAADVTAPVVPCGNERPLSSSSDESRTTIGSAMAVSEECAPVTAADWANSEAGGTRANVRTCSAR